MTWFLAALTAPVWIVLAWFTLGDLIAHITHHVHTQQAQEADRA